MTRDRLPFRSLALSLTLALVGGSALTGCAAIENATGMNLGSNKSETGEADSLGENKTETVDNDAQFDLPEYNGVKHAIGVIDAPNNRRYVGRYRYDLGNNLTIMLQSALFDTNRFVIVEREQLSDVIREQDLQASGRMAAANKVAQTGKLRPAKYLASVEITSIDDNTSGGGASGSVRMPGTGVRVGLGGRGKSAEINVIAKIIDSTTGEVVAKKSITGKVASNSRRIRVSNRFGSLGGDDFQNEPLGQAAQDCINQAVYYIAKVMEDKDVTGAVVTTAAGKVIINRGERHNFTPGMRLEMIEEGEQLIDPNSGQLLGTAEGKKLGELKVARVQEQVAYCDVLTGTDNPAPGTLVRIMP